VDNLQAMTEAFQAAAEKVSAFVVRVKTLAQAQTYTLELCRRKEACQLLLAGCEDALSAPADVLCETKQQKVIAAPGWPRDQFDSLSAACRESGIRLIRDGLREHLAGVDIGFTQADYGIAETGTLVLDSSSEAVRLATMISEIHVALLPLSRLRPRVEDLEGELEGMMRQVPNYMAFITGASRTADIERVLALGVHGPLELHILLWEDC
jgi:L-lactate dehydrogenase complex protein LldG